MNEKATKRRYIEEFRIFSQSKSRPRADSPLHLEDAFQLSSVALSRHRYLTVNRYSATTTAAPFELYGDRFTCNATRLRG